MANFPTKQNGDISRDFSPSLYKNEPMVETMKGKTEGGYEHRRRRFTRKPRRAIEIGFIDLSQSDFETIEAFYDAHLEDTEFSFYDPIRDEVYTCRFDEWKPDYSGLGENVRYGLKIKMSEV